MPYINTMIEKYGLKIDIYNYNFLLKKLIEPYITL